MQWARLIRKSFPLFQSPWLFHSNCKESTQHLSNWRMSTCFWIILIFFRFISMSLSSYRLKTTTPSVESCTGLVLLDPNPKITFVVKPQPHPTGQKKIHRQATRSTRFVPNKVIRWRTTRPKTDIFRHKPEVHRGLTLTERKLIFILMQLCKVVFNYISIINFICYIEKWTDLYSLLFEYIKTSE